MSEFGWFLAFVGVVLGIVGLLQMRKGKKMNTVPFRRPSEITQLGPGAADAKGFVSTEGTAVSQQPLIAPMSGQPCLAYEITVKRKWEKQVETENGSRTESGTDSVLTQYQGSVFQIRDEAGVVGIDATKQPDAELEKSHSSTERVGMMVPGVLTFGQMQINTPSLPRENRTVAFVAEERILKAGGSMYALGKLEPTAQGVLITTPPGLTTGRLMLSSRGREAMVKKTKRNMVLSYAFGGVMFVGGSGMGVFGPHSEASASTSCHDFSDAISCNDRMYAADGETYTWTVTHAGEYQITVRQPNVSNPIDSAVTVTDAAGTQLAYNDGGAPGANATIRQVFQPGTYRLNVRDFTRHTVSGGYSFSLEVADLSAPQPGAVPAAAATTAAMAAPGATPAGDDSAKNAAEPSAPAPGTDCARAVSCCQVLNPNAPAGPNNPCAHIAGMSETSCHTTLTSLRRAVRAAHPRQIAACN